MNNVRQFELYGLANGQTISLNNNTYFLNLPKGLGIKVVNEYFTLGTLQIKTKSDVEYENITGNLLISSYNNYEIFRKFVAVNKTKGFKLYYTPKNENLKKYILCDIVQLQKSEIEQYGHLNCPVTITPKTAWLTDKNFEIQFSVSQTRGKKYPFRYPYRYNAAGSNEAVLTNDGDFEIPLEIYLEGPFINLYLRLFDTNNKLVQSAMFEVEVGAGERFFISSNPETLGISLFNINNEKLDKTTTQDYERTTYLTLPVGTYTLKISEQNESTIAGVIKAQEQYLGA